MIPHRGPNSFAREEEQLRECSFFVQSEVSNRWARVVPLMAWSTSASVCEVKREERVVNVVGLLFRVLAGEQLCETGLPDFQN